LLLQLVCQALLPLQLLLQALYVFVLLNQQCLQPLRCAAGRHGLCCLQLLPQLLQLRFLLMQLRLLSLQLLLSCPQLAPAHREKDANSLSAWSR
jgi:hypothetical protein